MKFIKKLFVLQAPSLQTIFYMTFGLLLSIFSSLLITNHAQALEPGDIVLQVYPAEQEIDLVPNETYSGKFMVENVGRLGFTFHLSSRPYQISPDTNEPDFTTTNSYTALSKWLSFSQNDVHLEPGESIEVTYSVSVPSDVPGGGQYAAIIVETRDDNDDSAMRIVSQVAVLLYAHIEGEQRLSGVILEQNIPTVSFGGQPVFSATVENTGNVDFDLIQSLSVTDFFTGRSVVNQATTNSDNTSVGISSKIVLPATRRTSILIWETAPKFGLFRVTQTLSFLDEVKTYEGVIFICPIWLLILVIFLFVLLIIWSILRLVRFWRDRQIV